MNEVELIDRYLDALYRNPKAPAPEGLDAKTAAFVHRLWLLEQPQNTKSNLEAAIWQKALRDAESQKMADGMTNLPISRNSIDQPVNFTQLSDDPHEEKNTMLPTGSVNNFTRTRSASIYGLNSLVA